LDLLTRDLPPWLLLAAACAFGAIWGSFFNVAIYRWPRDLSVVRPPSTCPACQKPIAARHNIPIFGYFLLRGRAACCGAPLSPRYPAVEALSAVLCIAIVQRFIVNAPENTTLLRASMSALAYFFFAGGLLIATFVDLEFMEIPDEVSLPGAALGLASAVFRDQPGAEAAALGAGGGYLLIQLVFVWSYEHLTGRRGMGEGDSKLLLMIGAFLGWQGALFAVFAGAGQGLLTYIMTRITGVGLPLEASGDRPQPDGQADGVGVQPHVLTPMAAEAAGAPRVGPTAGKQRAPAADGGSDAAQDVAHDEPPANYWGHLKLPFGPFLALGALEYLFFGEQLIEFWLRVTQPA
jgi:leader peptidase (prepilin peptidase)/N-methyltransferase